MVPQTAPATTNKKRLVDLFSTVGNTYHLRGLATTELHLDSDVHAFYHLVQSSGAIVHVRGFPTEAYGDIKCLVTASIVDNSYKNAIIYPKRSLPNTWDVIELPGFRNGARIPYESQVLEEMLAADVPELGRFI